MTQKPPFRKKLVLNRETLARIAGAINSGTWRCSVGCPRTVGNQYTCADYTCPVVSKDWPSCDATFCDCLTLLGC